MNTRKKTILKAIIEEYVETAQPIGSFILVRKYDFNLSPATLRNEMAELENRGYLGHVYTSSGRVPTDKGYRYFVNELMEERRLVLKEKVKLEKLLDLDLDQLFRQATKVLASLACNLTVVRLEDGFWEAGLNDFFNQPEFNESQEIQRVSKILDSLDEIINEKFRASNEENIFIGKENPLKEMENCSIVITKFRKGRLGILGPKRMKYAKNKALLDFTSELLDKVLK